MSNLQNSTSQGISSKNTAPRKRSKLENRAPVIASSSEVKATNGSPVTPLSNLPTSSRTAPELQKTNPTMPHNSRTSASEATTSNGQKHPTSSEKATGTSDVYEPKPKKSRFSDDSSLQPPQPKLKKSKPTSNQPSTSNSIPTPSAPSTSAPSAPNFVPKRDLFEQKLQRDRILKANFIKNQFLTTTKAKLISEATGLTEDAVQIWFENQREGAVRYYIIDANNELPWQLAKLEHGYQELTFKDCVMMAGKWGITLETITKYFQMRGRFQKCSKVPKKVLEAPSTSGEPLQSSKLVKVAPRPNGYLLSQHNYLETQYVPGHTPFFYCQDAIMKKTQLSCKQIVDWYEKRIKWDEEVTSLRVRKLLMPYYLESKHLGRDRPDLIRKETKLSAALITAWFYYQKNKEQAQPVKSAPSPDPSVPSAVSSSTSIAPVDSDDSVGLLKILASDPNLSVIQDDQRKKEENQEQEKVERSFSSSSSVIMLDPVDSSDSGGSPPSNLASIPDPPKIKASQTKKKGKSMKKIEELHLKQQKDAEKQEKEKQMEQIGKSLPSPQPSSSASYFSPVGSVEMPKNDPKAPDAHMNPELQVDIDGEDQTAINPKLTDQDVGDQVRDVPQDPEVNFGVEEEIQEEIQDEIPEEIRRFLSQWLENNSNPTIQEMEDIGKTYKRKGWEIFKHIRSQKVIQGEQAKGLKKLFTTADITRLIREIRKYPVPTLDDIQNLAVQLKIESVELYKMAKEACGNN